MTRGEKVKGKGEGIRKGEKREEEAEGRLYEGRES